MRRFFAAAIAAFLLANCSPDPITETKEAVGLGFSASDPDFEWKISNPFPFSDGYELFVDATKSQGENRRQSSNVNENDEWIAQNPVEPDEIYGDQSAFFSLKDPSIIRHEGFWHLFCTRRAVLHSHSIEYLKLEDLETGHPLERVVLPLKGKGIRAPQVFFFTPDEQWYLLFQKEVLNRGFLVNLPFFSTSPSIDDPGSWSEPQMIILPDHEEKGEWEDFWFISDRRKGFLFMTSKEGKFYRSETSLEEFPAGFSTPEVCLEGDFIEGGHVYWVPDWERYLAVIVASRYLQRYHKAYVSRTLDSGWEHFAITRTQSFVSISNVEFPSPEPWADSFGHGELIRSGRDETMTVSTSGLAMLLPAVERLEMDGKLYREVPWKLALVKLIGARVGLLPEDNHSKN